MTQRKLRTLFILAVILISLGLRLFASTRLSVDYDEPVYLQAAINYANIMREGKFTLLAWDETTYEHPALYKILYGVAILDLPPLDKLYDKDLTRLAPLETAPARHYALAGRRLSIAIATIAIAVFAMITPLAGLFLGIHTLSVNYTSEFYLEALPLLTSLLSVLAYGRWFNKATAEAHLPRKGYWWLAASALCLGLTAAGKYVYCITGLAIACHFSIALVRKQIDRRNLFCLLAWGLGAFLMFFIFDPYLWPHPISRFIKTITFHLQYKESAFVQSYAYPFWQSLRWLSSYLATYGVRPGNAFLINLDWLISGLALIGLPRLWKKNPLFFLWLVLGIGALFIWKTKWPQYSLIVLAPFCAAAAEGAAACFGLAKRYLRPPARNADSP